MTLVSFMESLINDQLILDELTTQAKASPRLRMNLDLRNSLTDKSRQILGAIEPGTVLLECKDGEYAQLGEEDIID